MGGLRAWKFRLYPSKSQIVQLDRTLYDCTILWNSLLNYTKNYHLNTGRFPKRSELYKLTKETTFFSQVAQNVADKLLKSVFLMVKKKKSRQKAGFPRFKQYKRLKSFTYPQRGFKLENKLHLSNLGVISIKKHRQLNGKIKTLTIKKSSSNKWYAIFISEVDFPHISDNGSTVGLDLGVEHFAYLSDGTIIENPKYLKRTETRINKKQRHLSRKIKYSVNRTKARLKLALAYEKLANKRRDFLHKISRFLVRKYSMIAMEKLDLIRLTKTHLAKNIYDCSWAEFSSMMAYKAEEAGCKLILVNPAGTTSECSGCGRIQKKSLRERWHWCFCGASMPRDLNSAVNILNRATGGTPESKVC